MPCFLVGPFLYGYNLFTISVKLLSLAAQALEEQVLISPSIIQYRDDFTWRTGGC